MRCACLDMRVGPDILLNKEPCREPGEIAGDEVFSGAVIAFV
jgi:hypothetical protein